MAAISKLFIEMTTKGTAQVKRQLHEVDNKLRGVGKSSQSIGGQEGKGNLMSAAGAGRLASSLTSVAGALTAVGAGVTAVAAGYKVLNSRVNRATEGFNEMAQSARELRVLENAFGMTREAAQDIATIADRAGISMDDLATVISDLNERAQDLGSNTYAEQFERLGLVMDDLRAKDPVGVFNDFRKAFAEMGDPAVRASVGAELLGDKYMQVLDVLLMSDNEFKKLLQDKDRNRFQFSDVEAKFAKEAKREMIEIREESEKTKRIWDGLFYQLGQNNFSDFSIFSRQNREQSMQQAGMIGSIALSGLQQRFPAVFGTPAASLPSAGPSKAKTPVKSGTTYTGPVGASERAFGLSGVPLAPGMNEQAFLFGQDRDNFSGGLFGMNDMEEPGMRFMDEFLSEVPKEMAAALENSSVLPEEAMWSGMLDDLRQSNTFLQLIEGHLNIIRNADPTNEGGVIG